MVVTPEYNHSFPGALKVLIDAVGAQWSAKPVGFISYGGVSGGLRAVEHLRQVFAELHAVGLRDSVALHAPWGGFATPQDSPPGADAALELMLDRMAWWAGALTAARTAIPYVRAA